MSQTLTLRLEAYDKDAQRLVEAAQQLADERKHAEVEPLHLFYRILERAPLAQEASRRAGVDPTDVLVEAEIQLRKLPRAPGVVSYLSARLLDLLARAEGEAARSRAQVSVAQLLVASAQEAGGGVASVLRATGLNGAVLRAALATERAPGAAAGPAPASPVGSDPLTTWGIDLVRRAELGELDPVVGRDDELRRVMQILARRSANNPLLVGEAGIGKRSIVRALAQRIAAGDVPPLFQGKRIVEVDFGLVSAGTKLRAEADERVRSLLAAARERSGQIILFLPDLSQLTGEKAAQGTAPLFAAAMARGEVRLIALATPDAAKKAADGDKVLLAGFAPVAIDPPTPDEAVAILRGVVARYEQAHGVKIGDPALTAAVRLARRYVPSASLPKAAVDLIDEAAARVRVEKDATPAELDALRRRVSLLRTQLESLSDDTDEESQRTFAKLESDRKALEPRLTDLEKSIAASIEASAAVARLGRELTEARAARDAAAAKGDNARAGELRFGTIPLLEKQLETAEAALKAAGTAPASRDRVMESDVADVVAAWTGVPVSRMMQEETQKLLAMEDQLRQRVIGQDAAVTAVSKAVRRGRVGLRDPKKPIGSFLFLGPTGVGKTELAKALAEFLFDDEASLTRLDMSEFMEKHSVARLLGSPPGYVDSEEGGFLTEAVRKRPYSVILFDEMEKAHPDVFNILLQVLDDGRLTDSRGNLAHFADTVIIMTSNVGSASILDHGEGVTREAIRAQLDLELRKYFRPEFLNRIDDTIIFDPLGKKDLRGIVEIQLRGLSKMLGERGVKLELTEAAKDRLVELGHEPAFGARPVKRVILKNLQDPLAEEMLRGGYLAGDTVKVDAGEAGFSFSHERPA